MAEEKTISYPSLPARQWWTLREKFKQSIPRSVTANYLATVLNMQERSADANILRPLKAIGLLDKDGKPTELAVRWRDDPQYPDVCDELRKLIYPSDLLDAFPNPGENREAVERWFANRTKQGAAAVGKMSGFYLLLSERNPNPTDQARRPAEAGAKIVKRVKAPATPNQQPRTHANGGQATPPSGQSERRAQALDPSVHLDIQIHISSDASVAQIEQIFASMAKHLYQRTT